VFGEEGPGKKLLADLYEKKPGYLCAQSDTATNGDPLCPPSNAPLQRARFEADARAKARTESQTQIQKKSQELILERCADIYEFCDMPNPSIRPWELSPSPEFALRVMATTQTLFSISSQKDLVKDSESWLSACVSLLEREVRLLDSRHASQQDQTGLGLFELLGSHMKTLREGFVSQARIRSQSSQNQPYSAVPCIARVEDERLIGLRMLSLLPEALRDRSITCSQLALLLLLLPAGDQPLASISSSSRGRSVANSSEILNMNLQKIREENNTSTFTKPIEGLEFALSQADKEAAMSATLRVELLITMCPRMMDPFKIQTVLQFLTPGEVAQVLFRLGWFAVWSPLRPDGHYVLNLERSEDRQILQALILLERVESVGSLRGATWREKLDSPRVNSEWQIPDTWQNEATLPTRGILAVQFCSERKATSTVED